MYLQTSTAARRIGITNQSVLAAVRRGDLRVADHTDAGMKLYDEAEVERFRQARQARIAAHAGRATRSKE